MDEFVLWKRKANLKIGHMKLIGNLSITNKRILFKPIFSKEIEIGIKSIKNVSIVKKFIKRIKIEANDRQYLFFTKKPEYVVDLIKKFIINKNK